MKRKGPRVMLATTTPGGLVARILVIDDSEIVLEMVQYLLIEDGHAVVTAEDWRGARIALKGSRFDMALIDVNLPGLQSGDVMAKQMKMHPALKSTKLVLFSGTADEKLNAMVQSHQLDGYITKGKDDDAFKAEVRRLLD